MNAARFNLILDTWASIGRHPAILRALGEHRVAVFDASAVPYHGAKETHPSSWERRDYLYYTIKVRGLGGGHTMEVIVCEGLEVEVVAIHPPAPARAQAAA